MKQKRVVHIISSLGKGGAERSLYNLLNSSFSDYFESTVICIKGNGSYANKLAKKNILVIELNIRFFNLLPRLFVFFRTLRLLNPDIVQGWMYHGNLLAILSTLFLKKHPKVCWNIRHSLHNLKLEKPVLRIIIYLNRFFSRKVDTIIFNSTVSLSQHTKFGFNIKNSMVIPNGFSADLSKKDDLRTRLRKKLDLTPDDILIGHIARFHPMKGHGYFLEHIKKILLRNKRIHLLMIGRDVTNENSLFKEIPTELKNKIYLLGEVDDSISYMNAMDIFILTSHWGEGFPNVLAEAMIMKLICISTEVGDVKKIIGNHGFILPSSYNIEDLQIAINNSICIMNHEETKERARNWILENFSEDTMISNYKNEYNKLFLI